MLRVPKYKSLTLVQLIDNDGNPDDHSAVKIAQQRTWDGENCEREIYNICKASICMMKVELTALARIYYLDCSILIENSQTMTHIPLIIICHNSSEIF
jgi:hypothetical protein